MITVGIGQLAKRVGVPIDTVRHYQRIELLRPAGRLASGYRRFGDAELKRSRFIRKAAACPGHGWAEDCPIPNALQQDEPR